ncbi:unnamed protein product [Closterium sp. Yama58-4]|nr:unnamed protein product [Closterium sp. Yama58-4]
MELRASHALEAFRTDLSVRLEREKLRLRREAKHALERYEIELDIKVERGGVLRVDLQISNFGESSSELPRLTLGGPGGEGEGAGLAGDWMGRGGAKPGQRRSRNRNSQKAARQPNDVADYYSEWSESGSELELADREFRAGGGRKGIDNGDELLMRKACPSVSGHLWWSKRSCLQRSSRSTSRSARLLFSLDDSPTARDMDARGDLRAEGRVEGRMARDMEGREGREVEGRGGREAGGRATAAGHRLSKLQDESGVGSGSGREQASRQRGAYSGSAQHQQGRRSSMDLSSRLPAACDSTGDTSLSGNGAARPASTTTMAVMGPSWPHSDSSFDSSQHWLANPSDSQNVPPATPDFHRPHRSLASPPNAASAPAETDAAGSLRANRLLRIPPVAPQRTLPGLSITPKKANKKALVHRGPDGSIPVQINAGNAPVFTAEKARKLREMLKESETHHDTMYHSGIASRLAQ